MGVRHQIRSGVKPFSQQRLLTWASVAERRVFAGNVSRWRFTACNGIVFFARQQAVRGPLRAALVLRSGNYWVLAKFYELWRAGHSGSCDGRY